MRRILRADLKRLGKSFAFWLSLLGMLMLSSAFMFLQATAMDYTVPLSRVIFLPMSIYGIVMAAFVSAFVGTDFSDGFIRNKLLVADNRSSLVISQTIVSCVGCIIVYILVIAFSFGIGRLFFENNVETVEFTLFFILGTSMSVVTGCIFSVITMISGNKTQAIILCMGIAFGLFFLCLHTNEVLVQTEYKNGVLNPHYVNGIRREVCSVLHDMNPCGQAAQLSAWKVWHPVRALIINLFIIAGSAVLGCSMFCVKDVK